MNFVKPSHGDDSEAESSNHLSRSTFDPHSTEHQVLNKQLLNKLLSQIQKSVPNTGLQQFWVWNCPNSIINYEILWRHVIFSHMHASSLVQENYYNPTLAQSYDYLSHMKLPLDEVTMIEKATRGQSENELWFAIRNGRLTSSRFVEIPYSGKISRAKIFEVDLPQNSSRIKFRGSTRLSLHLYTIIRFSR